MSVILADFASRTNDTVEVIQSMYKDYNPFPSWCDLHPKLSEEEHKILKETWRLLLSGNAQGFRQHKSLEGNAAHRRTSFGKYSPTKSAMMSSPSSAIASTTLTLPGTCILADIPAETPAEKPALSPAMQLSLKLNGIDHPEASSGLNASGPNACGPHASDLNLSALNVSAHKVDVQPLILPTQGKPPTDSPPDKHKRPVQTPRTNPEAFLFFLEVFYEKLAQKDLTLDLKLGGNLKFRNNFLIKLCTFVIDNSEKMNTPDFAKNLHEYMSEHNKNNVTASDLDILGQVLLSSLKQCLGNDYSLKVQESWRMAYSQFLKQGLQYIDCPKTLYIKKKGTTQFASVFKELSSDETDDDRSRPATSDPKQRDSDKPAPLIFHDIRRPTKQIPNVESTKPEVAIYKASESHDKEKSKENTSTRTSKDSKQVEGEAREVDDNNEASDGNGKKNIDAKKKKKGFPFCCFSS